MNRLQEQAKPKDCACVCKVCNVRWYTHVQAQLRSTCCQGSRWLVPFLSSKPQPRLRHDHDSQSLAARLTTAGAPAGAPGRQNHVKQSISITPGEINGGCCNSKVSQLQPKPCANMELKRCQYRQCANTAPEHNKNTNVDTTVCRRLLIGICTVCQPTCCLSSDPSCRNASGWLITC